MRGIALLVLAVPLAAAGDDGPAKIDERLAGHFLNRAAYGPSPEDLARIRELGAEAWVAEQLDPGRIDDAAFEALARPLFEQRGGALRIRGLAELKQLVQLRALHSRRQLQAVLADFWENHFTTDAEKVAAHLDALQNSDAGDAFTTAAARLEAADLEHRELDFFTRNALGTFGDLLGFSARSPAMLIYLDSILNVKGRANENYAREILELHCLGVDNGYVQKDIEQLGRAFTGWGVARVAPGHAANPHAPTGVRTDDRSLACAGDPCEASGRDWRYFKGTQEPPPGWREAGFDDSAWEAGPAGIGYGDDDDATVLKDMAGNYTTVYLRKTFTVAEPAALREHLILGVEVDDGFVAFLNGVEIARYNAPGKAGEPVPFTATAPMGHEAAGPPIQFNLNAFRKHLLPGRNALSLIALNVAKGSSDLTLRPHLLERKILPGSFETGDPRGVFAFHYSPALHDARAPKALFKGLPQAIEIAPREGPGGLAEAEEAIERILAHPSTPRFVCVKLIRKFVGDEIDFRRPGEGPYADLLRRCTEAWNTGTPRGNLKEVMKVILGSPEFRSERAYRAKVKDPFEFLTSSLRALGARGHGRDLPPLLQSMGMAWFTRKEPDGWPELGDKLVEMGSFQKRLGFVQALSLGTKGGPEVRWDPGTLLAGIDASSPETVAAGLNRLLFQGQLAPSRLARLARYLGTDVDGNPLPLVRERADYEERVRQAVGLALSLPQWQLQ